MGFGMKKESLVMACESGQLAVLALPVWIRVFGDIDLWCLMILQDWIR